MSTILQKILDIILAACRRKLSDRPLTKEELVNLMRHTNELL